MGQLTTEIKNLGHQLVVHLLGEIDEDVKFPDLSFGGVSEIIFDFDKVALINSCGIREWLSFLKHFPEGMKVSFRKCPPLIIDQVNMISGFIPAKGEIESFYVPYYSDDQDKTVLKLFSRGVDFQGNDFGPPEVITENGVEAELDVIPAKYFQFLKRGQ
jgi:hypothetical protein